jgi:hypothetical protein
VNALLACHRKPVADAARGNPTAVSPTAFRSDNDGSLPLPAPAEQIQCAIQRYASKRWRISKRSGKGQGTDPKQRFIRMYRSESPWSNSTHR